MNKILLVLVTLAITSIFVSSSIPDSEAKLWDFVVDIEFLESPVNEGKNPILIGTVVDHAYRPLSNIDVKLTVAGESHMLKTDGNGEFGVISSVSQPFCGDCTRARLSPEGQFVTCLFAESGKDLRKLLRHGVDDRELSEEIASVWAVRDDKYSEDRSSMTVPRKKVEMYHIGG